MDIDLHQCRGKMGCGSFPVPWGETIKLERKPIIIIIIIIIIIEK